MTSFFVVSYNFSKGKSYEKMRLFLISIAIFSF